MILLKHTDCHLHGRAEFCNRQRKKRGCTFPSAHLCRKDNTSEVRCQEIELIVLSLTQAFWKHSTVDLLRRGQGGQMPWAGGVVKKLLLAPLHGALGHLLHQDANSSSPVAELAGDPLIPATCCCPASPPPSAASFP